MKIGDLVKCITYELGDIGYRDDQKYGIIVEWYCSAHGLVKVYWDNKFGRYEDMNPMHIKNLEVMNESR
jgi:hypothetical protein